MVDLVATGQKETPAAKRLAGDQFETLRKDYRREKKAGRLPKPSTDIDHKASALLVSYEDDFSRRAAAARELLAAELAAKRLGLDVSENLDLLYEQTSSTYREMADFLAQGADYQRKHFSEILHLDADDAVRRLREMHQILLKTDEQLKALQRVRRLRVAAWRPK